MGFFDFLGRRVRSCEDEPAYDVLDVADCILRDDCFKSLPADELCCILYWVQAEFLVTFNKKCFSDDIVAWSNRLGIRGIPQGSIVGFQGFLGNYNWVSQEDQEKIIEIAKEVKKYYRNKEEMFRVIKTQTPYKNVPSGYAISCSDLKDYFCDCEQEAVREKEETPKESKLELVLEQFNAKIPRVIDASFRLKLCDLYDIVKNISKEVDGKPEQEKKTRQLSDYYIPTISGLLDKYLRLAETTRRTPDVERTLKSIESLPDKIIEVANAVYDGIMEENLIDINADISVLKQKAEGDKVHKKFIIAENGAPKKPRAILYIIWDIDGIKDIDPNASEEQYAYTCSTHRYYKKDSTTGYWNHCEDSKMADVLGYRTVVVR